MTSPARLIRVLLIATPLALVAALLYSARADLLPYVHRTLAGQWHVFEHHPLPVASIEYLYDMGVVDADSDGHLDLYTANHNYQQFLFRATGDGGFRDVLSEWKLDQSVSMPGIEQAKVAPPIERPGLYVYWFGDTLHLRFHAIEQLAPVKGTVRFYNLAKIVRNDGVEVREDVSEHGMIPLAGLELAATRSSHLVLYPLTRGTPVRFRLEAPWARTNTFVGRNGIVPQPYSGIVDAEAARSSNQCQTCLEFEMTLLDRHSMAWSDINHDGHLDVFINRGALGGRLRSFPPAVRSLVSDELLVSLGTGRFVDRARELGIEKKDCSGRHVRWIDFDRDGLLDLFINCQDRGNVAGGYPKQFYRQGLDKRFEDVASRVKLDLPEHQLVDLVWFDADGDGHVDLFTHEDTGYYLYRLVDGAYERQHVHTGPFHRANVPGLTGNTTDYWQFDGKLAIMDFDADGDLDVLVASKRGNVLLVNEGGTFRSADLAAVGLPPWSVSATWVDYDNNGLMDLHVVPDGLYRQDAAGRFVRTGLLAVPALKYQGAIVNWFDRDNDGALDVVIALQENAALWRWWERLYKSDNVKGRDDRFDWKLLPYRNLTDGSSWLQVELAGPPGNPQAIGAHVTLIAGAKRQARQIGSHEGSYLSQGHYRLYFGLGQEKGPVSLEIVWPDGRQQTLRDVRVNQRLTVAREE